MLDPTLLQSFLVVAQTRNFTEAGRRLGLQQSTVSQHVRKLEALVGPPPVPARHPPCCADRRRRGDGGVRPLHPRGERAGAAVFLRRAAARAGAVRHLGGFRQLPPAGDPARLHPPPPGVDLELTVDLSATLNARFDQGELDLVLAKRRTGEARGQLVWRDRLVWIGGPGLEIDPQAPLPLILYAPPSLTRSVALETLERQHRTWRVVCTSGSLSGLRAAALAGLGITLHARSLIPDGLTETPATLRLPDAGEVEFVVDHAQRHRARPGGGAGRCDFGERRPAARRNRADRRRLLLLTPPPE